MVLTVQIPFLKAIETVSHGDTQGERKPHYSFAYIAAESRGHLSHSFFL